MEEIKESYFRCESHHKHESKAVALDCEKTCREEEELEGLTKFEIKEHHLKLLKRMYVGWNDYEFGAPEIDPKRPYGNSDVIDDMAEILRISKDKKTVDFDKDYADEYDDIQEYFDEAEWNEKTSEYLERIHREMRIVLQIVLATLSIETGFYERKDEYSNEWIKTS